MENGTEQRTCANCTEAETQPIPAAGHRFELGKCQICGAEDPNYNPGNPGSGSSGGFFSKLLNSIRNIFKSLFSWLPFCTADMAFLGRR